MDYISIIDENNNSKKMEIVSTFELEGYNNKYIIYCELDKSHYYIAKYKKMLQQQYNNYTNDITKYY